MIRTDVNLIKEDWNLFFAFSMGHHRWTQTEKKRYLGHGSGTSHHHRPKILEIGRPKIGCYIGNKANIIHSHEKERHITDWSVILGNFNKGNGQKNGGKCFRHNKANSNPLPPLFHKQGTGNFTAIGHWQRWWDMPRSTQKLAYQTFGGNFKCPRNVLTTTRNYFQVWCIGLRQIVSKFIQMYSLSSWQLNKL